MESKKNKKPFITRREAAVSAIILLLILSIYKNPDPLNNFPANYQTRAVSETEADLFLEQIKDISASETVKKIDAPNSKATLMVFYTSWCPYCKILLPNILDMKSGGKLDGINLLFVSVDKDKSKLANYILQHNYDREFTPYILNPNEEKILKNIIISKGGHYTRAIPYSLFFDSKGNLVEENVGMMNKKMILNKAGIASGKSIQ